MGSQCPNVTRQILIDDSDPGTIEYNGAWFTQDESPLGSQALGIKSGGSILDNTLHGSNQVGDNFEYTFRGASITILGTVLTQPSQSSLSSSSPTNGALQWTCTIENLTTQSTTTTNQLTFLPFNNRNNVILCQSPCLSVDTYRATVTLFNTSEGTSTLWLDSIAYSLSPFSESDPSSDPFGNSTTLGSSTIGGGDGPGPARIRVDASDSAIIYGNDWTASSSSNSTSSSAAVNTAVTNTQGAALSVNFTGSQLAWYGQASSSGGVSSTYTVDNGRGNAVSIPDSDDLGTQLFVTSGLDVGLHQMMFVFGNADSGSSGSSGSTTSVDGPPSSSFLSSSSSFSDSSSSPPPSSSTALPAPSISIGLSYIIINQRIAGQTPLTDTPGSSSTHHGSLTRPAIIGLSVGATLLLVLTLLGALFLWKRHQAKQAASWTPIQFDASIRHQRGSSAEQGWRRLNGESGSMVNVNGPLRTFDPFSKSPISFAEAERQRNAVMDVSPFLDLGSEKAESVTPSSSPTAATASGGGSDHLNAARLRKEKEAELAHRRARRQQQRETIPSYQEAFEAYNMHSASSDTSEVLPEYSAAAYVPRSESSR